MTAPNHRARRASGFTLVELLVVVAVFAFLAIVTSASALSVASEVRSAGTAAAAAVEYELTLAGQLVQYGALALLLFGAGFWYMVELHVPGRLDTFRLGHFLLLALTYSLFFAVFAVLADREIDAALAVGIAAAVSFPLLALHVTTIVDLRFALAAALPLALVTTGSVVTGVYGGALRGYVYLALVAVVIGYLTVTYPHLQRGHEQRRTDLEARFTAALDRTTAQAAAARDAIADAQALLGLHDPAEHAALREWVEHRLDATHRLLDDHETMVRAHDAMRGTAARTARRQRREAGMALAGRLLAQLPHAHGALTEAATALAERRTASSHRAPARGDTEHCIACGHVCATGTRYCPGCGTPCARTVVCQRCHEVLRLPVHLLHGESGDAAPVTHCLHCGERHVA